MALGKSLNNILEDYFGEESLNMSSMSNPNNEDEDSVVNEVSKKGKSMVSVSKGVGEKEKSLKNEDIKEIAAPTLEMISLINIVIGPYQTRTDFDDIAIDSLAESIRENGLIQPILVHKNSEGGYTLLAGERRYRACKQLGLKTIEAKVMDKNSLTEEKKVFLTAYENLLREDLNPIELAKTYELLIDKNGLSVGSLANNLGKSSQYVKNYLKLLELSKPVQAMLSRKELTEGQARHLYAFSGAKQLEVANQIASQGTTVRQLESVKKASKEKNISAYNIDDVMLDHPMFTAVKELADKMPNSRIKFIGALNKGKIVLEWKK
jgi:ParB family transcriptional regulator, chromosome partitioning protein